MNHATGPPAFDLFDDTRTSRDIVKHVLAFLQFHLAAWTSGGGGRIFASCNQLDGWFRQIDSLRRVA
jgi:hypothetical protein